MKETLNNQISNSIATKVIFKFLYLILTLKNFIFNGINYLQIKCCAMGTICVPVYVNMFMGNLKIFISTFTLEKKINILMKIHRQYFFSWKGTESELTEFIDNLNKKHPTIKFEFTYFKTSIAFLDTKIYNNNSEVLCTTIFRKPNDRRNFLHYDSAIPKYLKESI